jgi:hypothetical protein
MVTRGKREWNARITRGITRGYFAYRLTVLNLSVPPSDTKPLPYSLLYSRDATCSLPGTGFRLLVLALFCVILTRSHFLYRQPLSETETARFLAEPHFGSAGLQR